MVVQKVTTEPRAKHLFMNELEEEQKLLALNLRWLVGKRVGSPEVETALGCGGRHVIQDSSCDWVEL